jgi:hypothetical protein
MVEWEIHGRSPSSDFLEWTLICYQIGLVAQAAPYSLQAWQIPRPSTHHRAGHYSEGIAISRGLLYEFQFI